MRRTYATEEGKDERLVDIVCATCGELPEGQAPMARGEAAVIEAHERVTIRPGTVEHQPPGVRSGPPDKEGA